MIGYSPFPSADSAQLDSVSAEVLVLGVAASEEPVLDDVASLESMTSTGSTTGLVSKMFSSSSNQGN